MMKASELSVSRREMRGLSLLELCIAIVVAALVLFAVFEIITTGMRCQARSRTSLRLAALAQKALETTRLTIVYPNGAANTALPSSPMSRVRFTAPDEAYGYKITFYNFEKYDFPPDITIIYTVPVIFLPFVKDLDPDPNQTTYLIAVKAEVDGPTQSDGVTPATGYREMEVVTLMHYDGYTNASPPASNTWTVPGSGPGDIHMPPPP